MEEKYMSLITEYIDGTLSDARKQEFDSYVKEGFINMDEVRSMTLLQEKMQGSEEPIPSEDLSSIFYAQLAKEQERLEHRSSSNFMSHISELIFTTGRGRLAFGFGVLVIGLVIGKLFTSSVYNSQLENLSNQMTDMKEVMMMSMLDEESVTSRLKGVQMSNGIVSENRKVTDALFITLNSDESTNVRLAALATLAEYAQDPMIREGIIKSITQQRSPLVQVALAELMVDLQESQAKEEFESILNAENTPDDVKTVLRENLDKIM